jgi:phosphate transport system substrate-binding protein
MSRDLEAEEDEEDLNNYLIGKDGVGIIVHPSNPLSNLTIEQVKDVFSGVADNWSILGGDNSNIMVVGRDPESTTYKGLNEIILKGAELPESAVNTNSADEMIRTVAANPAAIGFVALKDLKENVKALDINGVQMNKSTILTDRYPISRSFYFVIFDKPDSRSENRTSSNFLEAVASLFKMDNNKAHYLRVETIMDFLDFVKSDRGQKIIEKDGAIAVY